MVGMNGNWNTNIQRITDSIDLAGQVPVIGGAVGIGAAFGTGDLDNDRCPGALGGAKNTVDDQMITPIGGNGHCLALGQQGPVNHLTADK